MSTISIEAAQVKLVELIRNMAPGEEVIITAGNHPVARLTSTNSLPIGTPRQPGSLSGTVTHMAPDFDAPLDDFRDYMP